MIEELVQKAATHAGLSLDQSRSALSGALFLIDKHGEPDKVTRLFEAIPGSADMARDGAALTASKGGGLMAMNQQLTRQGVTISDMQKILPLAMTWVQEKTGSDLLRDVLASIPGLGPLLT